MDEQRMNKIIAFFSDPGLARFIASVRATYRVRGVKGFIRVSQLSAEECELLGGLLNEFHRPGDNLKFPMKKLQDILLRSGFAITIREMLGCLEGQEVLTRLEWERLTEKKWNHFIDEVLQVKSCDRLPPEVVQWVERLRDGTAQGSRILRRLYTKNQEDAQQQFAYCLEAVRRIWEMKQTRIVQVEGKSHEMFIRLPVLAAKVAQNAHAFDFKYPAGRLLWYGLREIFPRETDATFDTIDYEEDWGSSVMTGMNENDTVDPVRSLEIRETYRVAGIADDDISSQVILFAPQLTQKKEELVLTLRLVERLPAVPKCSGLYVVENPSVFATLLEWALHYKNEGDDSFSYDSLPILICLNGQPSAATIRLIDRCLEASEFIDVKLHYSGDLDVKGLAIAQALAKRYGKCFVPWRMSTADYERVANCGMPLSDQEKEQLRKMPVCWDHGLSTRISLLGIKVHQEVFVEELLQDWMKACGGEV